MIRAQLLLQPESSSIDDDDDDDDDEDDDVERANRSSSLTDNDTCTHCNTIQYNTIFV